MATHALQKPAKPVITGFFGILAALLLVIFTTQAVCADLGTKKQQIYQNRRNLRTVRKNLKNARIRHKDISSQLHRVQKQLHTVTKEIGTLNHNIVVSRSDIRRLRVELQAIMAQYNEKQGKAR